MKELHGTAEAEVSASIEECLAMLAAVERYPEWYPDVVRSAAALETGPDGHATRAEASLHVAHGPLVKDFELLLAVRVEPPAKVQLTRIPRGAADEERFQVSWQLSRAGGTLLQLDIQASLAVPRFLPLGGIGDAIATGFVGAARDALEDPGSTPMPAPTGEAS